MPISQASPRPPDKNLFRLPLRKSIGPVLLLLVLALGALLRFYHLDGYGLWSDEFVTLMIVSAKSWHELVRTCFEIPQPMPPLYFVLTRLPVIWLGPSEISLRLLSALSSLLLIYIVFRLGQLLFSMEVGLVAALLCAVNTTQIVYAQNARPYAFCLLLGCCSCLMFLRWLETRALRFRIGYVLSTILLFYSHYIFFPILLTQNLFFLWLKRRNPPDLAGDSFLAQWRRWLTLEGIIGLFLLPLVPQLATILRTRYSLNWYRELPRYSDIFVFYDGELLFFAAAATLSVAGIAVLLKRPQRETKEGRLLVDQRFTPRGPAAIFRWDPLIFLLLWYLIPVVLFFLSARVLGLNLFVERYLIFSTIPTYLIIAALPFNFSRPNLARVFLVIYCLHYVYMEPGAYYREKREFSQGVPGANEWRETLEEFNNPMFNASLFLFQSPFIESNQLRFVDDPLLFRYLSSPLESFYLKGFQRRTFALMPVHWWINTERHLRFKAETKELIRSHPDLVLMSTEEFWGYFHAWLEGEFHEEYRILEVQSFRSTGALRLNRIRLVPRSPS